MSAMAVSRLTIRAPIIRRRLSGSCVRILLS
jgi:hypothetical protein